MILTDVERWARARRQQLDAFDEAFQPWCERVRGDPRANAFNDDLGELHLRFTTAAYFAVIAAHQLGKALRLAGAAEYDRDLDDRVKRLRDVYEHWEDNRSSFYGGGDRAQARRAAARYLRTQPEGHPWMVEWSGGGAVTLGHMVRVAELRDLLDRVDAPPRH